MKSTQSGRTIALAVLLAGLVVLAGRTLVSAPKPSDTQMRAARAQQQDFSIAFLASYRDTIDVNYLNLFSDGSLRYAAVTNFPAGRVALARQAGRIARVDMALDGTVMVHARTLDGSALITNGSSSVLQISPTRGWSQPLLRQADCRFAALSPDGQTLACAQGDRVQIAVRGVHHEWRTLLPPEGVYGAPRLFNATMLIPHTLDHRTRRLLVSLDDGRTLATYGHADNLAFSRCGLTVAEYIATSDALFVRTFGANTLARYGLPASLRDYEVRLLAIADQGSQAMFHVYDAALARGWVVVYHWETGDQTRLTDDGLLREVSGSFSPDGTKVAISQGDRFWIGHVADARLAAFEGRQPMWVEAGW